MLTTQPTDFRWLPNGPAVFALISACIGLGLLIWTVYSASRQLRVQNFAIYTKRYQEILGKLPESTHHDTIELTNFDAQKHEEAIRAMRMYFDLCFEEFWLWKEGYLDKSMWSLWGEGIRTAMSRRIFQQAWAVIRETSVYGQPFVNFINGLAAKGTQLQKHQPGSLAGKGYTGPGNT